LNIAKEPVGKTNDPVWFAEDKVCLLRMNTCAGEKKYFNQSLDFYGLQGLNDIKKFGPNENLFYYSNQIYF
jgi:hypothetical protein